MWSELFQKQAPVCCWVVRPLPLLFWFPLFGLPGYGEVQHVPGKASGSSWNIYPRREETWGKLHGKLKGPNKEGGWGTARMTNIVTKQNFFQKDDVWPKQWNCYIDTPSRNQPGTAEQDLMGWGVFFVVVVWTSRGKQSSSSSEIKCLIYNRNVASFPSLTTLLLPAWILVSPV